MQEVLATRLTQRAEGRSRVLMDLSLILLGSLLVAITAQVSVPLPFSPVPITGQTLAVLLVGMALGSRRGALAMLAYLAEGVAGLPVFAEARAGLATLLGPTGGYLAGFVVAAWAVGALAERGFDRSLWKTLLAMFIGNGIIYAVGLGWLVRFTGAAGVLEAGLYPFLVGDVIKAVVAALLLPGAWRLLGERPYDM